MGKKYLLAFDQGTTSSRAIIFNHEGEAIGDVQKEITQIYPKAGWVEHDPLEIWESQKDVAIEVLEKSNIYPYEIAAIGITNQRETTIVWDKDMGEPIYNAIVWQCRRTAPICDWLMAEGMEEYIRENTGLIIDAYFSGTKIKWILDNVEGAKEKAAKGKLLFGNVDSWLLWNLTNGKLHITDYTNASRTMLFNIKSLQWDEKILDKLEIPLSMMPKLVSNSEIYAHTHESIFSGYTIPIAGIAGDQQAALFGQGCFEAGTAKNTYGTGCFLLMNTGSNRIKSKNGLITTIAWAIDGKVEYALEGSVFVAGAAIQWLRDELMLINNAAESENFSTKVNDNNGVYVVPAFVGLAAPHWDMYARGTILGLTRGSNKNHIIRATLESIAYQTKDVLEAMGQDSSIDLKVLKVDGGASVNNFLMQFQSDLLDVRVFRPSCIETTAKGAAYLAGLAVGFWKDKEEILKTIKEDKVFYPSKDRQKMNDLYKGWKKAVKTTKTFKI